jgi:hypothetical protein
MIFSGLLAINIAFVAAFPFTVNILADTADKEIAVESTDEESDIIPLETDMNVEQLEKIIEPETEAEVIETEPIEVNETESIDILEDTVIAENALVSEASYYYDIPLDYELQDHVFDVCETSGVDSALIIAMIYHESGCDVNAIGDDGRAFGLMQIHPRWNEARMYELQCWNLLDPYENITVGVDIVVELFEYGMPTEWVLMAYNGGVEYANNKINRGEVSDYALRILGTIKELN